MPGYANFAITEPPLKLVLLENPGQGGDPLNHLGVEVRTTDYAVEAGQARLAERGPGRGRGAGHHLLLRPPGQVLGHGAPAASAWEIYTVLQDSPTFWGEDGAQRWDAVQAELDADPTAQATQCCGGPQAAGEEVCLLQCVLRVSG